MIDFVTKPTNGLYKFVRVNGEFRFADVSDDFFGRISHASLVRENESASDAGLLNVNSAYWRIQDSYSMSLKVGITGEGRQALIALMESQPKID